VNRVMDDFRCRINGMADPFGCRMNGVRMMSRVLGISIGAICYGRPSHNEGEDDREIRQFEISRHLKIILYRVSS
jgi:hypothetical protein